MYDLTKGQGHHIDPSSHFKVDVSISSSVLREDMSKYIASEINFVLKLSGSKAIEASIVSLYIDLTIDTHLQAIESGVQYPHLLPVFTPIYNALTLLKKHVLHEGRSITYSLKTDKNKPKYDFHTTEVDKLKNEADKLEFQKLKQVFDILTDIHIVKRLRIGVMKYLPKPNFKIDSNLKFDSTHELYMCKCDGNWVKSFGNPAGVYVTFAAMLGITWKSDKIKPIDQILGDISYMATNIDILFETKHSGGNNGS